MVSYLKSYLPFICLGIYTVLSFYFSYERILNVDNSYFFFNIVDKQIFFTPENRYGVFFTQIPVILLAKIGVSLNYLLQVYSLIFPVFFTLIAFVCYNYFKVKEAALSIAFILIIGVAHSFFHPVTETYHALVYAVLLYTILVAQKTNNSQSYYYYSLVFIASFLSIISHPIGIFAIGFTVVFCYLTKQVKLKTMLFVFAIAAASLLLRMIQTTQQSYDGQQYNNMFNHLQSLLNLKEFYPIQYLLNRLQSVYLGAIILLVTFIYLGVKSKKYLLLFFSITSAILFSLIAIITFLNGDADMMMEKSFMPAIFMLILPFSYLFYNFIEVKHNIILIVLITIVFLSFRQIVLKSKEYTQRLNTLALILNNSHYSKIVANYSQSLTLNNWNTGIDSYILAKCKLNKTATIYLTNNLDTFNINNTDSTLFLGPTWWSNWHTTDFKSHYFELPKLPYKKYENKFE